MLDDAKLLGGEALAALVFKKLELVASGAIAATRLGDEVIGVVYEAGVKLGLDADDLRKLKAKSCSFHGDTLVLARRGYVPIRDIRAGDHKVWARHELTGLMGWRGVRATTAAPYEETVHVAIRDGESGAVQIIKSNRIHPFFAVRDVGRTALYTPASAPLAPPSSEGHRYSGPIKGGAWIDAQHLRKGDRLLNADESWAEVVSVSVERKNLVAYNLTVAQAHTYFVSGQAGADPVWVHNNCFHRQKGSLDNPPAHMRPSEVDSGRKLQADLQSSHPHKQLKPLDDQAGGDFVDNDGKLYDVMGEEGAFKFWGDGSNFKTSIDDHLLKSVDHVVIDLRGASPAQIDEITAHLTEAASRFGTAKINSVIFLTD